MKNVVITGSTRGIGLGLADAFLANNCRVMISSRTQGAVDQTVNDLSKKYKPEQVAGYPCDVTVYEQVVGLWKAAQEQFGQIDIWINNAGMANILTDFWEHTPAQMQAVVNTNVLGTMYGTKVALLGMFQQGTGSLYNMEGFGSRGGRKLPGLTLYGTTKAATAYLTDGLAEALKGKDVIIGSLSPGMVVTDLLLNQRKGSPEDWERSKRAFNILADKVETVSPWLVEQILENEKPEARKNGLQIKWLTRWKAMRRFLLAPLVKRNVIDET